MVVVSGLVAAAGDRMGHRAARAKIRIGKLRPRTASTVIAVASGISISLLTFIVVFSLSKDFRDAVLHFEKTKADLVQTEEALQAKSAELTRVQSDLAGSDKQLRSMRQQSIELVKQISSKQHELDLAAADKHKKQREVDSLTQKKKMLDNDVASGEIRVNSLTDLKNNLRTDIEQLETKVATYKQGKIALPRGTALGYQVVHAGDAGQLGELMQSALNRITVNLSKDGLVVAPQAGDDATAFIGNYPYAGATADVVVVISTASNVFENEAVRLAFDARSLAPLVRKGDVIMSVMVQEQSAQLSVFGKEGAALTIPAQFDADSLSDFGVALAEALSAAAQDAGFLPDLKTGAIGNPVVHLADVGADLLQRERPFMIQFVARQDLTALDGLEAAEIYISNPKAGQ
jgi:hypothetical protein